MLVVYVITTSTFLQRVDEFRAQKNSTAHNLLTSTPHQHRSDSPIRKMASIRDRTIGSWNTFHHTPKSLRTKYVRSSPQWTSSSNGERGGGFRAAGGSRSAGKFAPRGRTGRRFIFAWFTWFIRKFIRRFFAWFTWGSCSVAWRGLVWHRRKCSCWISFI